MFNGFDLPKSNFTPVPNVFFDELLSDINDKSELKVTLYVMRRTYGFQKKHDCLTIGQISGGIVTKSGKRLDKGTGLTPKSVRAGIQKAVERKTFLVYLGGNPGKQLRYVFLNTKRNRMICYALEHQILDFGDFMMGRVPNDESLAALVVPHRTKNQEGGSNYPPVAITEDGGSNYRGDGGSNYRGGGYSLPPQNKVLKESGNKEGKQDVPQARKYTPAFNEFWALHPIKRKKPKAFDEYQKAVKKNPGDHELMCRAIKLLMKHDQDYIAAPEKMKQGKRAGIVWPERFIKDGHYKDEYIEQLASIADSQAVMIKEDNKNNTMDLLMDL